MAIVKRNKFSHFILFTVIFLFSNKCKISNKPNNLTIKEIVITKNEDKTKIAPNNGIYKIEHTKQHTISVVVETSEKTRHDLINLKLSAKAENKSDKPLKFKNIIPESVNGDSNKKFKFSTTMVLQNNYNKDIEVTIKARVENGIKENEGATKKIKIHKA